MPSVIVLVISLPIIFLPTIVFETLVYKRWKSEGGEGGYWAFSFDVMIFGRASKIYPVESVFVVAVQLIFFLVFFDFLDWLTSIE